MLLNTTENTKGNMAAKRFYSSIVDSDIIVLSSVKSAEAVKVVENTFRDVNIAFVNELAKSFDMMGIDLSEVIKGVGFCNRLAQANGFVPKCHKTGIKE